jgi:hypothetical protein
LYYGIMVLWACRSLRNMVLWHTTSKAHNTVGGRAQCPADHACPLHWRLQERRSPGTSALIRTTFAALRDTLIGAFRLGKITAGGMISLVAAVVSQLRRMTHHRVTANVDGRVSDLQRAGWTEHTPENEIAMQLFEGDSNSLSTQINEIVGCTLSGGEAQPPTEEEFKLYV